MENLTNVSMHDFSIMPYSKKTAVWVLLSFCFMSSVEEVKKPDDSTPKEENTEKSENSREWWKSVMVLTMIGVCALLLYISCMILVFLHSPSSVTYAIPNNTLSKQPRPSQTISQTHLPMKIQTPNFILLTDLHMDPLYSEDAPISDFCRTNLGKPLDVQTENEKYDVHTCVDDFDLVRDENKAYYWGTFGCDSPVESIHSMFRYIQHLPNQPDFIVVLGDAVSHCAYSLEHLLSVMDLICEMFLSYYPNIPIIMALGNNDVYPHNSLAVGSSDVVTGIANIWRDRKFMREDAIQTFEQAGYYSVSVSDSLRVISMNTLYYYSSWCNRNDTSCDDPIDYEEDPASQFAWLVTELSECRSMNQKAYIIGHVGPQCSRSTKKVLWVTMYSDTFSNILDSFVDVIAGLFFSHVHRDTLNLILRDRNNNIVALESSDEILDPRNIRNQQTLIIPPAVSPNTHQNPSFRQVYYSTDNEILDYVQYHYDLEEIQENRYLAPQWKKEYSFTEAYDVPDLSPDNMFRVFLQLQSNQTLLEQWKDFHVTGSKDTDDFEKISDSKLICSMCAFCNYLGPCMNVATD